MRKRARRHDNGGYVRGLLSGLSGETAAEVRHPTPMTYREKHTAAPQFRDAPPSPASSARSLGTTSPDYLSGTVVHARLWQRWPAPRAPLPAPRFEILEPPWRLAKPAVRK